MQKNIKNEIINVIPFLIRDKINNVLWHNMRFSLSNLVWLCLTGCINKVKDETINTIPTSIQSSALTSLKDSYN